MSRCRITRPATLRKIAAQIGEPVTYALTRGGTGHRIDAFTARGPVVALYRDGSFEEWEVGTWHVPAPASAPNNLAKPKETP